MRIGHTVNMTILHLQRRLFGPGRFDAVDVRMGRVRFTPNRVGPSQMHNTQRRRSASPFFRPDWTIGKGRDAVRPEPWPYDTAFPTGLPEVSLFAGQQLTDMPSTGAQLAKTQPSDNLLSAGLQPYQASATPGTADHLGTIIDVFA